MSSALTVAQTFADPQIANRDLFNLLPVIDSARAGLEKAFGDRMELVAGDFFQGVPPGGDIYILKNIIHDWDDKRSADILASCRRAMTGRPSILLIVKYVRPGPQACPAKIADVQMMVRTGGRNRTEEEWRELLTDSGLRLRDVVPTSGPDIVEATRSD